MTDSSPRLRNSASKTPYSAQGPKVASNTSAPFSNVQPEALAPLAYGTFFFSFLFSATLQPSQSQQIPRAHTHPHPRTQLVHQRPGALALSDKRRLVPFLFRHTPDARRGYSVLHKYKVPIMPLLHHCHIGLEPTLRPETLLHAKTLVPDLLHPQTGNSSPRAWQIKIERAREGKNKEAEKKRRGCEGGSKNILVYTVLALLLVNQSRTAVHASAASDPPQEEGKDRPLASPRLAKL